MGFMDQFRLIRRARTVHFERDEDLAGRQGELETYAAVRGISVKRGWTAFDSRRIPRRDVPGKHEIDVLLVTPHALIAFEVKQWGGRLEDLGNGRWRQTTSRGDTRHHPDALSGLLDKVQTLRFHLQRQGIRLPEEIFHAEVVFANSRLNLPMVLAARNGISRLAQLGPRVLRLGDPNPLGFWASIGRLLGLVRKIPARISDVSALTRAIDRLPGWDSVVLHGGKILKGDILTPEFQLADGRRISRREAGLITVRAPRGWILGWFQSLRLSWRDLQGQRDDGRSAPGQEIIVRLAGRKEDVSCPLEEVLHISFGSHDESHYDAPRPSLESYQPETVYAGVVTGLESYGAFVDVDGHRTGLLHISRLQAQRRAFHEIRVRDVLSVRVLRASQVNGKERLDLDLAEDNATHPSA